MKSLFVVKAFSRMLQNKSAFWSYLCLKKGVQTLMYRSTVRATVVKVEPDKDICVMGMRKGTK